MSYIVTNIGITNTYIVHFLNYLHNYIYAK